MTELSPGEPYTLVFPGQSRCEACYSRLIVKIFPFHSPDECYIIPSNDPLRMTSKLRGILPSGIGHTNNLVIENVFLSLIITLIEVSF